MKVGFRHYQLQHGAKDVRNRAIRQTQSKFMKTGSRSDKPFSKYHIGTVNRSSEAAHGLKQGVP